MLKQIKRHVPDGQVLPALFERFVAADPPFEMEWNDLKGYALKRSATKTAVPFLRLDDGGLVALWYESDPPAVVHIGAHGDWGVVAVTFDDFLKAINSRRTGLSDIDSRDDDDFVIRGVKGKPASKTRPVTQNKFAAWLKKHATRGTWSNLEIDQGDLSRRMNDPKLQKKLLEAIEAIDLSTISKMLDANPGLVNERIKNKGSPLDLAAHTKNLDLVKLLVDKGADPNRKGGRYGIMHDIVQFDNLEIVRYLVSRGAEVRGDMGDGMTTLFAVYSTEMAQFLLDQGVDPKATEKWGGNALHHAAAWCLTGVAELLLKAGADVAALDIFKAPPLWDAAGTHQGDPTKLLQLLLKHGASLDGKDKEGNTPLHRAAGGTLAVVKWLLQHGADPKAKNNDGHTPLQVARRLVYNPNPKEIVAYLSGRT
jgi:ankyrin repeat protein